eukprot:39159_1
MASFLTLFTASFPILSAEPIIGDSSRYVLPEPNSRFVSDDYSQPTPPLNIGGRIMDLMNGEHFDNILQDTPDHQRPPSLVLFYNSSDLACTQKFDEFDYEDGVKYYLPSRSHLFAAQYDMGAAPTRLWYKWTPERDLASRFAITSCPSLLWVPRECNGWTDWCVRETINGVSYLGCDDFVEQCTEDKGRVLWNGEGEWIAWVNQLMAASSNVQLGGRKPGHSFTTMEEQEAFILKRDEVTTRTQLRNNWAAASLPAFSETGFKLVPMPKEMFKQMIEFYHSHKHMRQNENWDTDGTQVNGHEVDSYMVWMEQRWKDKIANEYIKPLVEAWVGFPLQLSSFYGMREYYSGHYLRNHIDRIDVLVISATCSVAKLRNDTVTDGEYNMWDANDSWPIEGVDWKGNNIRVEHAPGSILLYESAKGIHGRPYRMPGDNYVHVGAFSHFIPADGTWAKAGHDKNARANINRHTKNVHYSSEPPYYPPQNWKAQKENKQEL